MTTIKNPKPVDDATRKLAVSEQQRNIVVTAGAGTGKTTILVNRLFHMLLGHERFRSEESPIRKIVAMTFTEKAANDMKVRLLEELKRIVAVMNGNASGDEKAKVDDFLSYIRDTYRITYREIENRAKKSLEDMDKALIGTIHSFAAYILRLYPIEAGVVPGFAVDTGDVFDELFDKEWMKWLDAELTLNSPHAEAWKTILRRLDLESLRAFTMRLSGFTIPFSSLETGMNTTHDAQKAACSSLTGPLYHEILKIIPRCEKPKNNLLLQLQELAKTLDAVNKNGISYLTNSEYDLDKKVSEAKAGWIDGAFETAQGLVKECHSLLKKLKAVDEGFIKTVLGLVLPFAKTFRQTYLSQGYVSFDGLLTLTRDLLQNREYRFIRERLKSEFRAILVDEFQDTDPVQYEIVLFLSEQLGRYSADARKVALEPGKLFIVGDPKQSIYAFRRADIEAYEQVVKQVSGQDEILKLQENFRSHAGIIEVINEVFDGRIMVERPGLQPCYIPIHAHRPNTHPSQKVEMILVSDKEGEELKADEAREAEAEWIAQWIVKQVHNELIDDRFAENGSRKLQHKDVALLLRAFTQVRPYVEALKRYGIPYVVEGEKYFYTTQEVLDFMNLLRAIENPHDTISLVGILRSPVAGLTDSEIYKLRRKNLLDYRKDIGNETFGNHAHAQNVGDAAPADTGSGKEDVSSFIVATEAFYNLLRKFHARAGMLPVSLLISEIIENTCIAEITAAAWHGEQKLANILKLYRMACDMEQSEGISLKTFIDRITTRIEEAREEGESPLSDETLDVIKILTIHKSKGLEFPVVFLANLHGEVRNEETLGSAVFDWSTSATGIVLGRGNQQVRNLSSIVIEKKLNDRSWEEEKRVLYVAMTRAKERLILTGLLKSDDKSYMGLITQSLRDAAGIELCSEGSMEKDADEGDKDVSHFSKDGNETCKADFPLPLRERARVRGVTQRKFSIGNGEIFIEHFKFDGVHHRLKPQKGRDWDADWSSLAELWEKRRHAALAANQIPVFISPTSLSEEEASQNNRAISSNVRERFTEGRLDNARIIGSICHLVLENWDFHGTQEELLKSVESVMRWAFNPGNEQLMPASSDPVRQLSLFPDEGNLKMYMNPSFLSSRERYKGTIPKFMYPIQMQDFRFIKAEAVKILSNFFSSDAYKELQNAQILGREVPLLLEWNGQIMRGVIDIIYRIDGRVIIAEYKTDHVSMEDIFPEWPAASDKSKRDMDEKFLEKSARYRYQKEVYVKAVKRCLAIDNPEFKFIFLRAGN